MRRYTNSGGSFSCRSTGTSICHEPSTSGAPCERQCLTKNENAVSDDDENCLSNNVTVIKTNAIVNQIGKGNSHKHKNKSKKHLKGAVPNGKSILASIPANGSELKQTIGSISADGSKTQQTTPRSEDKRRENDATTEDASFAPGKDIEVQMKDCANDRILEAVV